MERVWNKGNREKKEREKKSRGQSGKYRGSAK